MPIELRKILPTGFRFRELWLPGVINGVGLPRAVVDGHNLALTGAQKRTTSDGVHNTGVAASGINCGAIHNAAAKFGVSFRFKLDAPFAAGADFWLLFSKEIGANDNFVIFLFSDGTVRMFLKEVGVEKFAIASIQNSWAAGTWYHVYGAIGQTIVGGAASNGARLRINGGVAVTNADASPLPNGGNMIIGWGTGEGAHSFPGVIADVCTRASDVAAAQELDAYNGIPIPAANNLWKLDEGMDVTAYDRGSGGNNGTLGAGCTWAFGGCKQPVLSLDGINDLGQSASGVNLAGNLTWFLVTRERNTQDTSLATALLSLLRVDATNYISLSHVVGTNGVAAIASGNGTAQTVTLATKPAINDYRIYTITLTAAGVLTLYLNGVSAGAIAGVGVVSATAAIAYLGADNVPGAYNNPQLLKAGLIEGAMSADQVRQFNRYLDQKLGLGLGV